MQWNLCFTTTYHLSPEFMAPIQPYNVKLTYVFMTICSLRPKSLEPKSGRKTQVPLYFSLGDTFFNVGDFGRKSKNKNKSSVKKT